MAWVTAELAVKDEPWSRAIDGRASGLSCRLEFSIRNIRQSSVRAGEVLGAAGRARAAHIVQFRTVGVERLGHELAPEAAEFGERPGKAVALRRGGKGCRTDRSHDA